MAIQAAQPSPSKRRKPEEGYILLVLVLFSALLMIGASRILPKAMFQGQREREEELIFRGMQYQRAIQLFVRKFGRYPNALEELEETSGVRFLRQRYRDPMSKEGEWRLIHVGPGGTFPDALAAPSLPTSPSGTPASSQESTSEGGASPPTGVGLGTGPGSVGAQPTAVSGQAEQPALQFSATPGANPAQQPRAAGSTQQASPASVVFGGGGIAGVASQNTAESIKVWNQRRQYNEWEFIYDFRTDPLGMAAIARVSGVAAQPAAPTAEEPEEPPPGTSPATQTPPSVQQPPRWRLGSPPGVRGQFPPSPVPGTVPAPRRR
ncbi:MAG: hypothetical protein HY647_08565 [Acidobacteria bacterium]|nr:hypothetical protein [Acidobacteriota bacterium]